MNKDFFFEVFCEKEKSCDPNTQVGCVIVKDHQIISRGYNTLAGCLEPENYPLDNRGNGVEYFDLDTKYPYILHSEAKAIINAKTDLEGCSIYVSLFPCNECAKLIIESGIKYIYYLEDIYADSANVKASKRMLNEARVECIQVEL